MDDRKTECLQQLIIGESIEKELHQWREIKRDLRVGKGGPVAVAAPAQQSSQVTSRSEHPRARSPR